MPTHELRAVLLRAPLLAPLFLLTGCPGRPTAVKTTSRAEAEDPLATVRETLRRERDVSACQIVVAQLNVYLSRNERKPAPLPTASRDLLVDQAHLTPGEFKEVDAIEFTGLDAAYLEERLLLHDAVRSLNLDWADSSAATRVRLALAWVFRQTWLMPGAGGLPPVPVLRRGSATEIERAGIVLAAFQSVGVHGCLIGTKSNGGALRIWAVGALVGPEVLLFDSKSGRELGALKQIRAKPDLVQALAAASKPAVDAKTLVDQAELLVSPPLSSLAPRMKFLQDELKFTPSLFLSVDPVGLTGAFIASGEKPVFWNPALAPGRPLDASTPLRALAYFTPMPEGGLERREEGRGAAYDYANNMVPWERLPPMVGENVLPNTIEMGRRLRQHFGARFVDFHLLPGRPRDQILRGQFDEVTPALVDMLTKIAKIQDRVAAEGDVDTDVARWAGDVRAATAKVLSLERNAPPGDPALSEARDRLEMLQKGADRAIVVIEKAAADPLAMAATYQLALAKHEQAERESRRPDSTERARDAWQSAAGWWNTFLSKYGGMPWVPPGQIAHARMLHELAAQNGK